MKKIFLIALAFAAFSGVKAQNEGFSIAPKIGMNVSKVSDMSFSDVKAKSLADFNIGLTGQYRFEILSLWRPVSFTPVRASNSRKMAKN